MKSNNVSLDILAHGKPMHEFQHEGKTFVESREGSTYSLRIKNHSSGRVKVVIGVDSINAVDGKPMTDQPTETGYILGAHEEHVIKGYRVDDDTVAQFTFVKRDKSYATEKGSGANNGVISLRVYEEKESESEKQLKKLKQRIKDLEDRPREKEYIPYDRPYPVYPWRPYWERPYHYWSDPWYSTICKATTDGVSFGDGNISCSAGGTSNTVFNACSTAQNAGSTGDVQLHAMAMQSSVQSDALTDENPFDVGSGWGSAIKDSVKMVEFEVGKLIGEVTIYYASLTGLKALGVNVERVKSVAFPEPFAKTWCAKPSGWKG